eukprot:1690434-Rhodomonas_salina.2
MLSLRGGGRGEGGRTAAVLSLGVATLFLLAAQQNREGAHSSQQTQATKGKVSEQLVVVKCGGKAVSRRPCCLTLRFRCVLLSFGGGRESADRWVGAKLQKEAPAWIRNEPMRTSGGDGIEI